METLKSRADGYNFFAYIFLALPEIGFIENIFSLNPEEVNAPRLSKFINENRNADKNDLLTRIAVDRAYLIRGTRRSGPRPPYESLYASEAPQDLMEALSVIYRGMGFQVEKEIHEPPDYIGVELSFMKELCTKELEARSAEKNQQAEKIRSAQKDFFYKHLGFLAQEYSNEIIRFAETDFYQSIGGILKDFVENERKILN